MSRDQAPLIALVDAVRLNKIDEVSRLIHEGAPINDAIEANPSGLPSFPKRRALVEAAFWGRLTIARILVEAKADLNLMGAPGGINLETPLTAATNMNRTAVTDYLLQAGANVWLRNGRGKTAFDIAAKKPKHAHALKALFAEPPSAESEEKVCEDSELVQTPPAPAQIEVPASIPGVQGPTG